MQYVVVVADAIHVITQLKLASDELVADSAIMILHLLLTSNRNVD